MSKEVTSEIRRGVDESCTDDRSADLKWLMFIYRFVVDRR